MIVTVNTDASFSKKAQVGTYAYWIICDQFKLQGSGVLKDKVTRPEISEFRGLINALHILFKKDLTKVKKIIINTDCLNIIHLINNDKEAIKRYKLRDWGRPLVHRLAQLRTQKKYISKIPLDLRHVRSHTGETNKRSYVNDWCDKMAKQEIHEKLKQLGYIE